MLRPVLLCCCSRRLHSIAIHTLATHSCLVRRESVKMADRKFSEVFVIILASVFAVPVTYVLNNAFAHVGRSVSRLPFQIFRSGNNINNRRFYSDSPNVHDGIGQHYSHCDLYRSCS